MLEKTNKVTRQKFYGCAKFGKGGCGETASHEDEEDSDLPSELYMDDEFYKS